jgi:hypothetical protein
MLKKSKKPKKGQFIISIDDGYCQWEYPIITKEEFSIENIYEILCGALKITPKPESGLFKKLH